MRFLLDACAASRRLRDALSALGHDVRSARGELARASDEALLALAYEEGRVLVTEDKDFGELVFLRRLPHPCIVRLVELRVTEQVDAMRDLIERHGHALRAGAIVVVTRRGCGYGRRNSGKGSMAEAAGTSERGRELCQDLQRRIGTLFTCSVHGDYQRIRTPYLYPDGDNIDLFCKVDGDTVTVSDLAETTGWLRMQSAALRRSPKQTRLIEDACVTHGIEFYRGMLQARCRPGDELAQVVTRVAPAALRVSDLWFTFRTQAIESITDEVADFLNERELAFDRAEKLVGRSGRGWTVDFHVRAERRSSLVQVLSTGNRAAAHRVSEHVLAAWHDLNHLVAGPEALTFVSLFDDTADVWADEDFRLVEPLSTLARWSRPDEFAAVLSEAA